MDKEAEALNIIVKPFPDWKEAKKDFDFLVKNINADNIVDGLKSFDIKYCSIDPYINLSFKYEKKEKDGRTYEFGSSFNYQSFSKEKLEEAKKEKGQHDGVTFKRISLTLKLKQEEDYHRYDLEL